MFFPTCQVRVVRFYVSWLPPSAAFCRLPPPPDLNHDHPRQVFPAGPQPRPSTPSVPCRTSTARIHAKCSLPDLNRENPRQVFPAGPQPRPSTPSEFPAGPQPRESTPSVPCRTSTARIHAKCSLPDLNRQRECQKICQIECQIERQIECQIECQRRMPDKNARYECQMECQIECQRRMPDKNAR